MGTLRCGSSQLRLIRNCLYEVNKGSLTLGLADANGMIGPLTQMKVFNEGAPLVTTNSGYFPRFFGGHRPKNTVRRPWLWPLLDTESTNPSGHLRQNKQLGPVGIFLSHSNLKIFFMRFTKYYTMLSLQHLC